MRIVDYESGTSLCDVSLELTRGEAQELAAYLDRMLSRPDLRTVHITDLRAGLLCRELTIHLNEPALVA